MRSPIIHRILLGLVPLLLVEPLSGIACRRKGNADEVAGGYVKLARAFERGEGSSATARALLEATERLPPSSRVAHLKRQLKALLAGLEIRDGRLVSFDEESRLLFGAVAPEPEESESRRIREELDALVPGDGPLLSRYQAMKRRFDIPPDRMDAVVERAIAECRRRTREHLALPAGEGVAIEYVSGKPWPSFSTYRGDYESVVQINRDAPLTVASVVDVATHEAYPGHHTASVLLDAELVRAKGWVEFSVEPTFGPDALIREGLAQYGADLLFPGDERRRFTAEVLGPLSGVSTSPEELDSYLRVEELVHRLAPVAVAGARQYVDGRRDRVASVLWLENEALVPDAWAFLRFVDRYRSYVLAYTRGAEIVRGTMARETEDPWTGYSRLLSFSDDDAT